MIQTISLLKKDIVLPENKAMSKVVEGNIGKFNQNTKSKSFRT